MAQIAFPQGTTPQGQQLASGQPNAGNSQAPQITPAMIAGDPSAFQSDQQLTDNYNSANTNVGVANSGDTRQNLVNNSGIPQAQGNYDQLAQQLFQYDSAVLNPKFGGPTPTTTPSDAVSFGRVDASPIALTPGALNNPVAQIMSMSNPKYAYGMQSAQADSITSLLDTLNSGIKDRLNGVTSLNSKNIDSAQKQLDAAIQMLTLKQNAKDKAAASAKDAASIPGTKANAGAVFEDILTQLHKDKGDQATETDLFNYIKQHARSLADQGVDMNEIWSQWRDTRAQVGGGGSLVGGKQSSANAKAAATTKSDILALKGFGDLVNSYYSNAIQAGPVGTILDPNARKKYESSLKVYTGQLQKTLGVGRGKYNFEALKSSLPSENLNTGSEGSFQGHLTSLLDMSGLIMYRDKKTGEYGLMETKSFDPKKYDVLDPQTTPVKTSMEILRGL